MHSSICLLPSSERNKQPSLYIFPYVQDPTYSNPGDGYKELGFLTPTLSQILVLRRVGLISDKVSIVYPEKKRERKGLF